MYNLKIAFRNFRRNGIYSIINIVGLAVSLAAVIIIALWLENELTFNRWYRSSDRLYVAGVSGKDYTWLKGSEPLVNAMRAEFLEVKRVSHFLDDQGVTLFAKEEDMVGFKEPGAYVDSTIFEMLDVRMVHGSGQSAFQPSFPIVISESLAKKIFGKDDPVGKTLRVNNYTEPYQVTGVFKEQPKNSSFQFQWLMPFTVLAKRYADGGWNPENDWHTTWFQCCVELQPTADLIAFNDKLRDIEKLHANGSDREVFLYPISQLYLYGDFVDGKPVAGKRARAIKELSVIAAIILLIACINFMNLATARSEKRMMEIGVRKTFGAKRGYLIWQLMRESAILTASSLVLALVITLLVLPIFNRLWNIDLSVHLWSFKHLCGIVLVGIICTVLAGLYPSFYISSFNPSDILKKLKNRTSNGVAWVRKGLVIFQFAASSVLICVTIAVTLQIRHGQNRPMGFDKEHLLRISQISNEMAFKLPVLREELGNSGLVTATAISKDPLLSFGSSSSGFQWQGKHSDLNPNIYRSHVSPGYVGTVGFRLLEGRDFYEGRETDANSVIINKTMVDMMGSEGKVNSVLWQGDARNSYTIVGIMDDYVFDDVYRAKSEPLMLHKDIGRMVMPYLFVRFNAQADAKQAMEKAQNTLAQFRTDEPLEYVFVDEIVNRMFDGQKQEGMLVALFSILSILISCLGLLGLVTYIAESKTKEIGIRKILGASVGSLVGMLTKEFLVLVVVSTLVAFPLAYYWIDRMLQDYSYRITIGWGIFVMAMIVTIALTLFTVGWQARKAATTNPVKSLKTE